MFTPKPTLAARPRSLTGPRTVVKNLSLFPAEVKRGGALPSGFSSHTIYKQVSFVVYLMPRAGFLSFFVFWGYLLLISLFKMASKPSQCSLVVEH